MKICIFLLLMQLSFTVVAVTDYPILSVTIPLAELTDSAVRADIFDPVVDYINRTYGKNQYQKLEVNIKPMLHPAWGWDAHGFGICHIDKDIVKYNSALSYRGVYIQNGCLFMISGDYERYFKIAYPRKNVTVKLVWNRDMDDEEDPDLWAFIDFHSLGDKKGIILFESTVLEFGRLGE